MKGMNEKKEGVNNEKIEVVLEKGEGK